MKYICDFCDKEFKNEELARAHVSRKHGDWLRFIFKVYNVVPKKTVRQAIREEL